MNKRREKLANYLQWLITPQNEKEQEKFCRVVDDYIELSQLIPSMGEAELIKEINIQLKPYNLQIDKA
jgi:hypothetical protein